jgi:hypothetical protein
MRMETQRGIVETFLDDYEDIFPKLYPSVRFRPFIPSLFLLKLIFFSLMAGHGGRRALVRRAAAAPVAAIREGARYAPTPRPANSWRKRRRQGTLVQWSCRVMPP